MIRAVFVDFDGTLYSHQTNRIPPSAVEAIDTLRDNGILVFFCTGRSYPEFSQFDLSMISVDGMILNNGQLATDQNGKIIYKKPIEGNLKERLIDIYNSKKLPMYLSCKDYMILNCITQKVIDTQNAVSSNAPEPSKYQNEDFYMASVIAESRQDYDLIMSFEDIAEVTCWHKDAYDIVPKGIHKASGIDEILKIYGIGLDQTMAFGDGDNDIEMIEHCRIGIAMGNSIDELKKVADHVTSDIDEDGLYNALKYFQLI